MIGKPVLLYTASRGFESPSALLRIGNAVIVVYAKQQFLLDFTVGPRVEEPHFWR